MMYDRHTEHGITEEEEITWHWLVLAYGAEGALEWIERWQDNQRNAHKETP